MHVTTRCSPSLEKVGYGRFDCDRAIICAYMGEKGKNLPAGQMAAL
jgi:hypothetical protein